MAELAEATEKAEVTKKDLQEVREEMEEVKIAGEERVLDFKNQLSQMKDSGAAA